MTALGRPVGADRERSRRKILAATMRCVARNGYRATTIREIAREAGMTSAALYNYFPTKSELIAATMATRADIALPRLRSAARRPGTVVQRLVTVLEESGRLMREYPDLAAFEFAIRAEAVGRAGATEFTVMREIVREITEDAFPPTAPGRADLAAAVEAVYALVYGLTELAATASAQTYQRALKAAEHLIRGTLFAVTPPR